MTALNACGFEEIETALNIVLVKIAAFTGDLQSLQKEVQKLLIGFTYLKWSILTFLRFKSLKA